MYIIMSAIQLVIKEKRLAKSLWNEITSVIVYVKNYYPSTKGKTAFEKYNKEPLDIFNLRVFGYCTWVQVSKIISRSSNHFWSWQSIMIGYERPNQGKIYNLLIKKVYILRDINFDEDFVYNVSFNEDVKAMIGEFWFFENN